MNTMSRHHRFVVLAGALLLASWSALARAQDAGDPALANMADANQPDPPQRVARISVLEGTASFEPASVNEFSPAEINYPMTNGDRLYSGDGSLAEIQTGQMAVRLGAGTDLTVTAMTDTLAQFGLAGGSVHLRTYSVEPGSVVELDTPNVALTVVQAGDVRVDVDPNSDLSFVTVLSGQVQVDGSGFSQMLGAGQSLRLEGLNPLEASDAGAAQADGLDSFSSERDGAFQQAEQVDSSYVNDATVGAADLAAYGDWDQDADNGPVWYPRGVAVDWQPYRVGHWAWVAPWGWTWVEAEPWGFAPFHYGRWARFGARWGWVPGPRVVRPVWAPALVVFVGGADFSASLGYRGGVTAWFPLGPREAYAPWYHTSPVYLNRVNVSNIYNRDERAVRLAYNSRTPNPIYVAPMAGRAYANRGVAVAMPQAAFAAGRPAAQNQVRVSPQQMAAAPLLPHPLVTPAHEIVQPGVARALPVHVARPVLDARDRAAAPVQGQATIVRVGGANSTPYGNSEAGRTYAAPNPPRGQQQQVQPMQGVVAPVGPKRGGVETVAPNQAQTAPVPPRVIAPNPPHSAPTQTVQPAQAPAYAPPNPRRGEMQTIAPQPAAQAAPQPQRTDAGARALFNRATPPEPRPNFEQQRQAMESTDPGRPLSPRQMDNVRQNQPAGPAQQHEATPHPAPATEARPQPADRKAH